MEKVVGADALGFGKVAGSVARDQLEVVLGVLSGGRMVHLVLPDETKP
jgi:hypothetical protein